jgi:eukaryotic-like serine/threonine-protein kinase
MSRLPRDLQLIFSKTLAIDSTAERAQYLSVACGDDTVQRARVESLITAICGDDNSQDDHIMSTMSPEDFPIVEDLGAIVGPYRIQQQIGEGGMGVVFIAEQTQPIRRNVALKIIKPGMGSSQAIARFEAERQALALMDHTNIAKVLDAGATTTGRPYFVMELVNGVPITDYCDQVRLGPRERLELLVSVCQAIQHAHQKGVIHRDIKPSNVLVSLYDGKAVPKVIDFGVAKAIDQRLTERTLNTQLGTIVGTLEYMSPEQADNIVLDVDTRTDVYSLGVLLYELLTGTTPLERQRLKGAGNLEILRRIREEEPPPLSSRFSKTEHRASIAAQRSTAPAKLVRLMRGELDWIARKALEKQRNRRYPTANDLARDLQRFLANKPVEARPASAGYWLQKYARRHRAALATAGMFVLVLVAATTISIGQAIRATHEEVNARQSELETKAVLGFFRDKVLAAARPEAEEGGLGREVTLRAVLDAAEPGISAEFAAQPIVEAAIRDTLGTSYLYLGDSAPAIRQHERAMALRLGALGPNHTDTRSSMNNLAVAYRVAGRIADAIPLHERDVELSTTELRPNDPEMLKRMSNLASAYRDAGRPADAVRLFEDVLARRKTTLGPNHADTLISMNNLAVALQAAGRPIEAISLHELEFESCRARLGPNHPDTLTSMNNLAAAYQAAGRCEEAIPLHQQELEHCRKTLGPDHPDTLTSMNNLATAYHRAGRTVEAVPLFQEVLSLRKKKLTSDHPATLASMSNLAAAFLESSRFAEAEPLLRECLKLREKTQPEGWRRFDTMSKLGAALIGQGKYAQAEPLLVDGYAGMKMRESSIPADRTDDVTVAAARLVECYVAWGKPDKAVLWRKRLTQNGNVDQQKP